MHGHLVITDCLLCPVEREHFYFQPALYGHPVNTDTFYGPHSTHTNMGFNCTLFHNNLYFFLINWTTGRREAGYKQQALNIQATEFQ